ncbi:MAG: acetylxylan esterase [Armatimonadota bacterium]
MASRTWALEGVTVQRVEDGYTAVTDVYRAKVNNDGGLASLVINGVEFMAPATGIKVGDNTRTVTGLYACPMNNWQLPYNMPGIQEQRENVIRGEGHGWKLEYTFLPETIEITYFGAPDGGRAFHAGYPAAELVLSLSHDLERACDPEAQGELGWPVVRNHEPGNYAILAKNGAGLIAEAVTHLTAVNNERMLPDAPHRLDLLVYTSYDQTPKPLTARLRPFKHADLAHSLTMEITSPNPSHLFPMGKDVTFPVKVTALYGQTLTGTVAFTGSPYVWKTPEVTAQVPLTLTADAPSQTVRLPIRPDKPAHYTGFIGVTDGAKPLYRKRVGFLYRPEKIPAVAPPADFDAFWEATLAVLDKSPLDMTLEPQPKLETKEGIVYKVQYRAWDGRWAWAWMNVPKGEGPYPVTIVCPPVSVWQPPPLRAANGGFQIYIAIHGGDLKDYPPKTDFDYMNTGITSRETYMLRYSYSCLVRCYDIVKNHPKCNGQINVEGSSQGGGLSLVLAGLRPVTRVRGVVPALCRIDWTVLGYTSWGPGCPKGADPQQVAEVVRYYDPASFAHRIHAPLKIGFGLFDSCAPAEGIYSAINALPKETKCEIFADPYGGHFSFDYPHFNAGEGVLEAPRWYGTAEDNKIVR